MIQAISFDIGGTLIRPEPSVGHIYAQTAAQNGCPGISPQELNERFTAAWASLGGFEHGYDEWATLVDRTFAGLTPEPPSRTFFPQLYDRFAQADSWAIFPDVLPALGELSTAGFKLAAISNWDRRLRPLLRCLNLERCFRTIVVSFEVGCSKPAGRIFELAALELNLPPSAMLHVGDSAEADVAGAEAAGCRAVLLDRKRASDPPRRVNSLVEVLALASGK